MRKLLIHPKVKQEVEEVAAWYREIDPELAQRFVEKVYRAIQQAQEMPLLYRIVREPYRRVFCETFPYQIYFELLDDENIVQVLAVMHQKGHPDAWQEGL